MKRKRTTLKEGNTLWLKRDSPLYARKHLAIRKRIIRNLTSLVEEMGTYHIECISTIDNELKNLFLLILKDYK